MERITGVGVLGTLQSEGRIWGLDMKKHQKGMGSN